MKEWYTSPSSPVGEPGDMACDNYRIDMTATEFGTCVCGFPKREHQAPTTPQPTPRRRGTAVSAGSSSSPDVAVTSARASTPSHTSTSSPSIASLEAVISSLRSDKARLEADLHAALTQGGTTGPATADPPAATPAPVADGVGSTTPVSNATSSAGEWDLTVWLRSLPLHQALARLLTNDHAVSDQLQWILQVEDA